MLLKLTATAFEQPVFYPHYIPPPIVRSYPQSFHGMYCENFIYLHAFHHLPINTKPETKGHNILATNTAATGCTQPCIRIFQMSASSKMQ